MTLELNEYQAQLAIYAFEAAAFKSAAAAGEHRAQYLITNALELFSLAAKCRQGIGWPEYDPTKNIGL